MTIRYVGIGGNDGNDGLSWANRKLTLNGVDDTPVVAGDIIYIGPGTYREMLTVAVAGSAGNPITYIGDVTGEHTDGIGGIVRISGSDDDMSATRTNGIFNHASYPYHTYRGLYFDLCTEELLRTDSDHTIIEDCYFGSGLTGVMHQGSGAKDNIVRRCIFNTLNNYAIRYWNDSAVSSANNLVENCLINGVDQGIGETEFSGITVKNCTIIGARSFAIIANNGTMTVNNCIIAANNYGFYQYNGGVITENYNSLWGNNTNRDGTSVGANSNTYPPMLMPFPMLQTIKYMNNPFLLASWSPLKRIAGSGELSEDLFGFGRPSVAGKNSWGAIQYNQPIREITTVYGSSVAAIKLSDAQRNQFIVPITNVETTISVRVYREGDYTGTNPQMVIRQPGQSARTTVDTGNSGEWNLLTDTFTPSANPSYVIVELVSNNTATSGDYDVFFDNIVVE